MGPVRWIVGAALFLALLFLALDNAQSVSLRFFRLWEWQAPLIFVVFVAFATGVALGLVAGALRTAKVRRELSRARRSGPAAASAAPPPDGA